MTMKRLLALLALLCLVAIPHIAVAVEPGEMLKDPKLEARARELSSELRCMVCQNESIDESQATLAHDLRVLIRQRIAAGESNQQVRDYLVSRYGDFILLKPPFKLETLLLWGTPLLLLFCGGGAILLSLGRRAPSLKPASLSATEQEKLATLMRKDEG
jgi:cytochrome c-type biogenesis protein CcmH